MLRTALAHRLNDHRATGLEARARAEMRPALPANSRMPRRSRSGSGCVRSYVRSPGAGAFAGPGIFYQLLRFFDLCPNVIDLFQEDDAVRLCNEI